MKTHIGILSLWVVGCTAVTPAPPIVNVESHATAIVSAVRLEDQTAHGYDLLGPERTHLTQVFDDSIDTYLSFQSAVPAGLMIFDERGRRVEFRMGERSAIVSGVHAGLLIRTATLSTYAQAPRRGRTDSEELPAELAIARADILRAQGRLASIHDELQQASNTQDPATLVRIGQELEQIQLQIEGVKAFLMRAHFDSGASSLALSDAARAVLLSAAEQATHIRIRAGTDVTGSDAGNVRLARDRALSMRTLLVAGGVPAAKVSLGPAYRHYLSSNDTAEGRASNRRVDVYFKRVPEVRIPMARVQALDGSRDP